MSSWVTNENENILSHSNYDVNNKKRARDELDDKEYNSLDDFILKKFDRHGKSKNYQYRCSHENCTYDQFKKTRAITHANTHSSFKEEMELINNKNSSFSSLSTSNNSVNDELSNISKHDDENKINEIVANYILKNYLALRTVDDPNFIELIEKTLEFFGLDIDIKEYIYGRTHFIEIFLPSYINKIYNKYLGDILNHQARGLTLVVDSRTDLTKKSLLVIGLQSLGKYRFYKVIFGDEAKKDAKYYFDNLQMIIRENKYIINIVTDSASNCLATCRMLCKNFNLISIRCQAHCLNLILKHLFEKIDVFNDCLNNCNKIVCFFNKYNNAYLLLNKFTELKLLKFAVTRFSGAFFQLERVLRIKDMLIKCLESDEINNLNGEKEFLATKNQILTILNDVDFITNLKFSCAVSEPIVKVLFTFDKSTISFGYLWPIWNKLQNSISNVLEANKNIPQPIRYGISNIFADDFAKYYPIAATAAGFLNPLLYSDVANLADGKASITGADIYNRIKEITINTLSQLVRRELSNSPDEVEETINEVKKQLIEYANGKYPRITPYQTPIQYWEAVDNILSIYSIRLLSISYVTSCVERNHKIFANIRNKQRNKLSDAHLDLLTKGNVSLSTDNDDFDQLEYLDVQELMMWKSTIEKDDCELWLNEASKLDELNKFDKQGNNYDIVSTVDDENKYVYNINDAILEEGDDNGTPNENADLLEHALKFKLS